MQLGIRPQGRPRSVCMASCNNGHHPPRLEVDLVLCHLPLSEGSIQTCLKTADVPAGEGNRCAMHSENKTAYGRSGRRHFSGSRSCPLGPTCRRYCTGSSTSHRWAAGPVWACQWPARAGWMHSNTNSKMKMALNRSAAQLVESQQHKAGPNESSDLFLAQQEQ